MTIKFYDSRGELREVREVTGKLTNSIAGTSYCGSDVTGLIETREQPFDIIGHCPFYGGWMEVEA